MSVAEQIGAIVAQMPEKKQTLLLDLVKTMISPDDILTEEDLSDITQARAELARGEFVRDNEINWK